MSKVWLLASKVLSALLALAQAVWAGEKGKRVKCDSFILQPRKYQVSTRFSLVIVLPRAKNGYIASIY